MTAEEIAAKKHAYYLANKHKWKESYHRCYSADKNRPRCAKWRAKNRKKLVDRATKYRADNIDKVRAASRIREKNRRELDISFRLKQQMRGRISSAIKAVGSRKKNRTLELIGCDIEFLRGYLEARFQLGMSWENYGEWHIDHHIPCAEFDLTDLAQQKQCFNYTNLRPLWAKDNFLKSATPPPAHQSELL